MSKIKKFLIVRAVLNFLGEVPGAIRDHLNIGEIVRIVVASSLAGGGVYEAVRALAESIPQWVAPGDVGLVTAVFVLVIEVWRRLRQGKQAPTVES